MRAVGYTNDGLRFVLELAALASFAYWGVGTGGSLGAQVALAIVVPVVAASLWGLLVSPKARFPLRGALRLAFEVVFFGGAVVALLAADQPALAAVLGGLVLVHLVVLSARKPA